MKTKLLMLLLIIIPKPVYTQIPSLPEHDGQMYLGYDYGAAGIVDALLQFYNQTSDVSVLTAISQGLDEVWKHRVTVDGRKYPLWRKVEGGDIYTGIKYGTAGIASTFIHAYEILGNSTYLDWAEETMKYLYSISDGDPPRWGYALVNATTGAGGIPITDYRFGSTGIISVYLDLFDLTKDVFYLQIAENATSWLLSLRENSSELLAPVPWYTGFDSQYTSLFEGNAGILNLLIKLSQHTDKVDDWMKDLFDWFVVNQNADGSWDFNIAYPGVQRTSIDMGVSGIILPFLKKYNSFGKVIEKAYHWLSSIFITNVTHSFIPEFPGDQHVKLSLYSGILGVLSSYTKLYAINPNPVPKMLVGDTISWILENNVDLEEYSVIAPKSDEFDYIDLSYSDGQAGVLTVLNAIQQSGLASELGMVEKISYQISEIVDYIIENQFNGLWAKQITITKPDRLIFLIAIAILLPTLIYLIKKAKN